MSDENEQPKLERRFLSPPQIAKLTGIDVSIVRRAIQRGELPAVRTSDAANSKMRVEQADLWAWLERRKQPPDKE